MGLCERIAGVVGKIREGYKAYPSEGRGYQPEKGRGGAEEFKNKIGICKSRSGFSPVNPVVRNCPARTRREQSRGHECILIEEVENNRGRR